MTDRFSSSPGRTPQRCVVQAAERAVVRAAERWASASGGLMAGSFERGMRLRRAVLTLRAARKANREGRHD